jgi:PilZ domain
MHALAPHDFVSTRFHPRVDAGIMVKLLLHDGGHSVLAKARDVSMAGLRLVGDFKLGAAEVTVALALPNDEQVITRARVTRRDEEGLALEFAQLDWDDLISLARFVHTKLP